MPVCSLLIWATTRDSEIRKFCLESPRYAHRSPSTFYPPVTHFSQEKFWSLVEASAFYQLEQALVGRLWADCSEAMFSLSPKERQLGLGIEVGTIE